MKEDLVREIVIGKGVNVELSDDGKLKVKGARGEVFRTFTNPKVSLKVQADKMVLFSSKATKREKRVISTYVSHIKNMVKGVVENHLYRLKICSGHFPMSVSVSGEELIIKNFMGESVPRKVKLISGVAVKVDGSEIIVSSADKEAAGQTAASIEQLCRITNRDRRIFQDGCYITFKAGKAVI